MSQKVPLEKDAIIQIYARNAVSKEKAAEMMKVLEQEVLKQGYAKESVCSFCEVGSNVAKITDTLSKLKSQMLQDHLSMFVIERLDRVSRSVYTILIF